MSEGESLLLSLSLSRLFSKRLCRVGEMAHRFGDTRRMGINEHLGRNIHCLVMMQRSIEWI